MRVALHTRREPLGQAISECLRSLGHECALIHSSRELAFLVEASAADLAIVDLDDRRAAAEIPALRRRFPSTEMIALCSDAHAGAVVDALRAGVREVLRKPFGRDSIARAIDTSGLGSKRAQTWIAEDAFTRRISERARAAARGRATLLISGETGVGKTHLVQVLQALSPRADRPFVTVGGSELRESDGLAVLVGRESHDVERRVLGVLERAHTGTLLIEDVDELDADAEASLLRFLDDGSVRPLGAARRRHFDVRLMATLRSSARGDAAVGRLSHELETRLGVIRIEIPPLRERRDDIAPLARHFFSSCADPAREPRFDDSGLAALRSLEFPGNAAELENRMRRARLVYGDDAVLGRFELGLGPGGERDQRPPAAPTAPDGGALASLNLRDIERAAVRRSLELAGGNRTVAARALGVSTRTLRNKIRAYGLR